jgi:hypothetical protein
MSCETTQESDRVRRSTSNESLQRIDQQIEENIRFYSKQSPERISDRIRELENEWSIERYLETNAATLALGGAILGLTINRKWFLLPLVVMGFMFQHAIQGWCPPLPVLRRRGIRTRGEIDREKFALKVARGDFSAFQNESQKSPATEVAGMQGGSI